MHKRGVLHRLLSLHSSPLRDTCTQPNGCVPVDAYGGVSGNLFVCEIFLRVFRSIFEPDGQNAQKQGGKFGGSRNKIFKQSI